MHAKAKSAKDINRDIAIRGPSMPFTRAKLNPLRWLFLALAVVATSCTATGTHNQTITTDISGFPLKEGQILMEH